MDTISIAKEFEELCKQSRDNNKPIFEKDLDGIMFYMLPVTAPWYSFKIVKVSNKTELIIRIQYIQDWHVINEKVTSAGRLLNHIF